jgi:hypothetical protein
MATARPRTLLLVLLVLALTSCALNPSGRDMPLAAVNCRQALPLGYEVRGTLQTSPAGQDFLLALRTMPERIDLTLLTVQGLPVYRLSCADGSPQASVQTSVGGTLPPLELLNYLTMIFMGAEALSQQIQPGWTLKTHGADRLLARPGTSATVRISYQGTAPWFYAIELADSLHGVTLTITILESSRVLPE